MSEAAHSSTYMTRFSKEVMHPSGWSLFPTGALPTGVHCFRLQGCMLVYIPWFHARLISEPLSISMLSGSNGDSAEGIEYSMSRNVFTSIDATVISCSLGSSLSLLIAPSQCQKLLHLRV